jgi:hypothetical protein
MQTPWAKWFEGRNSIASLPAECVEDCSASGSVDDAVDYWVERLNFEAPAWLLRDHLRGCGAWDSAELCDHQANLRRLLWVWACDCSEDEGRDYMYLDG